MKATLNAESEDVTKKLIEALKSPNLTEKLGKWSPEELPTEEKKKVRSVSKYFFFLICLPLPVEKSFNRK